MKPPEKKTRAAIAAALEAIDEIGAAKPLRPTLSTALDHAPGLGGKERRHVAEAARGVARWLRPIDAALALAGTPKHLHVADRSLLRYLAWRISVLGEASESVAQALALPGPKRPRTLGDDVLRDVATKLRRKDDLPKPRDPIVRLALEQSVPDFLARQLVDAWGAEEARSCLAALNAPPALQLRVNVAKATPEAAIAALEAAGVHATPGDHPHALQVEDRKGLFDTPPFRRGWVEVQDEGSQAVVAACGAVKGQSWLDLCAGAGGKALALAAIGARVTAWDENRRRLSELPRRARRAGARIEVAATRPLTEFDGVLVDAPCSGSGTIDRAPDARWRITPEAVERFSGLQTEILQRGAANVRAGGKLVYATCSLLPEEGERVAQAFVGGHPAFSMELEQRRWPHRNAGGGFYVARFIRAR